MGLSSSVARGTSSTSVPGMPGVPGVATGQARPDGAGTERGSNGLWLALESIDTLLTSTKAAPLRAELIHADSRKSRGGVMLGLVVVNLMDGDGSVDDRWLDGLLLNDGLDGLVDVMMDMLASDSRSLLLDHLLACLYSLVMELTSLLLETSADSGVIAMIDLAGLSGSDSVGVLLGKNFTVFDGLDRCVVVVLVDLLVDGCLVFLDPGLVHGLLHYGGSDFLMDGCVLVTRFVQHIADGCLSFIHCEGCDIVLVKGGRL